MSNLKKRIIDLGLSYRKEITTFVIINIFFILCAAFIVLLKKYLICIPIVLSLLVVDIVYILRYRFMEDNVRQENLKDFVMLFTFFRIYIRNGYSVYTSLKEIKNFANPALTKDLDELISEIDNDKTITPFIHFAHKFKDLIIEEMMVSIYQMIDDGSNSAYLSQFELIFDKFSTILHESELQNKDRKLASMSYGPLIGSAFLIILITVGIVSVIGGMLNGI